MTSAPVLDDVFLEARSEFDGIETRLGELAAWLSDVADGLSHDPDSLDRLLADGWPDLPELLALRASWIASRDALCVAWKTLPPSRRATFPLPPFGAPDPSRPLL